MNPIVYNTKAIINTVVRLIPIGLYFGSILMGILFQNVQAFVLLLGFLFNDFISLGFRYLFQTVDIANCAVVESTKNFYTLPAPHTQTVAFTLSYFFTDMYLNNTFNPTNFIFLAFLLMTTIWSRMNVGCQNVFDAIFATMIGLLLGTIYYRLTEKWYQSGNLEESSKSTSVGMSGGDVEIYQRE